MVAKYVNFALRYVIPVFIPLLTDRIISAILEFWNLGVWSVNGFECLFSCIHSIFILVSRYFQVQYCNQWYWSTVEGHRNLPM